MGRKKCSQVGGRKVAVAVLASVSVNHSHLSLPRCICYSTLSTYSKPFAKLFILSNITLYTTP